MPSSPADFQKQNSTVNRNCRWVCYVVVVALTVGLTGCAAENSRKQINQLQLAIILYSYNHDGEWPDSLDQIKDELGGATSFSRLMKNPLTGDDPGYEYVKPNGKWDDSGFDSQQVMVYQLRDGKRDSNLKVGFADGSASLLKTS